jgi:molecular chaperone GrpE
MSSKHHERPGERESAQTAAPPESRSATAAPTPADQEKAAIAGTDGGEAKESDSILALRARAEAAEKRGAELEASAASLAEELSSLKDQYLRKLADYENFRKRMFRENEDARKYGVAALLGDLIPVLDDFDRGVASAEHARDYGILHDGIVLIRRQLGSLLEAKYGLARFDSSGQAFDPNVHEAVAMEQGPVAEAMVSEEFLPGYRLHDRVVRAAKVRVVMPAPAPAAEQDEAGAAGSN